MAFTPTEYIEPPVKMAFTPIENIGPPLKMAFTLIENVDPIKNDIPQLRRKASHVEHSLLSRLKQPIILHIGNHLRNLT